MIPDDVYIVQYFTNIGRRSTRSAAKTAPAPVVLPGYFTAVMGY
jgi:hypothetical protein